MTTLYTALQWYNRGVTPLPVITGTKRVSIPWREYMTQRPSKHAVINWFRKPEQNIALICGPASNGLVVLDFDQGFDTYCQWQAEHSDLADTYAVRTHKGAHAYLFCNGKLPQKIFMAGNIEVRSWLCTMAAPSRHPAGGNYTMLNNHPIQRINELAQALGGSATPTDRSVKKKAQVASCPSAHFFSTQRGVGRRQPPPVQSNSLISRIKQQLPILQLVAQYTNPLPSSQDGRWWIMCCPFHADKNPSFWVDTMNEVCGCHQPDCRAQQPNQRSMDIVNFYARFHKISNGQAICRLASELGIRNLMIRKG